ncbi:MAG: magnesium/cobalt transporter CorA [Flavobacteriales bacterium]|nr:magnesium/cobalt transporter CorA [Flavobacteriales bacterium]
MKKVGSRSGKAGLLPGSLIHVGDALPTGTSLVEFVFSAEAYEERKLGSISERKETDPTKQVSWLDIDGINSERMLSAIGERFNLHPLLLEDILNTDHRPKVEEYQDSLFLVAKMLELDNTTGGIQQEQVCFVLRHGQVISFQERPGDVLDPIRERIRKDLGRVRRAGSDYLLYSLLDVIVDQYFVIVEDLGRRIEALEQKVLVQPGNADLHTIQELRGLLITVNRYVTPTRELAGRLNTIQSPLIDKATRRYINDLQDHTLYVAETISTFREMLTSLENTYHAGQNMRMTQVMKLLTIISTIFIPLTFIVGVYGMNFRNMPELQMRYGYFVVVGIMVVISGIMLLWFRRKKWL